jgi:hypothetical protein
MDSGASITVTYWAAQTGENSLRDLDGIEDFRAELDEHYVSVVHGRPGDLGRILDLTIEIVSHLSLAEIAGLVASGVSYDILKKGAQALILRPFLAAYQKLRERNKHVDGGDVEILRLVLRDSMIVIYRICDDSVIAHLERILLILSAEYEQLLLRSGEQPFTIHIPVFEDNASDRLSRFRVLLDVDETLKPRASDYFKLWGLHFDFARTTKVYDVKRHLLLDEPFLTLQEYWDTWGERQRPTEK